MLDLIPMLLIAGLIFETNLLWADSLRERRTLHYLDHIWRRGFVVLLIQTDHRISCRKVKDVTHGAAQVEDQPL